jgi:hypothetical protein
MTPLRRKSESKKNAYAIGCRKMTKLRRKRGSKKNAYPNVRRMNGKPAGK